MVVGVGVGVGVDDLGVDDLGVDDLGVEDLNVDDLGNGVMIGLVVPTGMWVTGLDLAGCGG